MQILNYYKRYLLCLKYLKQRESVRKNSEDIIGKKDTIDTWIIRILLIALSSAVILVGAQEDGLKGFIHGTSIVGSLFLVFYLLPREVLLRPYAIRKCLALLMASVRFTEEEFELLILSLPKTSTAVRSRPFLILILAASILLLAYKTILGIVGLLIGGWLAYYLYRGIIRSFFDPYRNGKISAVSAKRLLTLHSWQELGGLFAAVFCAITIHLFFKVLSIDNQFASTMNIKDCYLYFNIALHIYFISKLIPIIISFAAPSYIIIGELSALFYVFITLMSVFFGTVGFNAIKILIIATIATFSFNMLVFYSMEILKPKLWPLIKSVFISIVAFCVSSICIFSLDFIFQKLKFSNNYIVTFCVFFAIVAWTDTIVFGMLSTKK